MNLAMMAGAIGVAGCTVVTVPAEQLAHGANAVSVGDINLGPPGTSVCTRIDPDTGTCPSDAWVVLPAD